MRKELKALFYNFIALLSSVLDKAKKLIWAKVSDEEFETKCQHWCMSIL